MRWLFIFALLASSLAASATAQSGSSAPLAALYEALEASEGYAEAQALEDEIWQTWLTAPDKTSQDLMDKARQSVRYGDYETAMQHLDALIAAYPDYAEGWNQRATLLYLQGRFDASLDDVAEVLAREPRHFGALAGRAVILLRQGEYDAGQRALLAALRVNPWLAERGLLDPAYGEEPL